MDNITKERRLLALVASHPPAPIGISSCALRRAGHMLGAVGIDRSEMPVGRGLGFSDAEIYGIMDGWDVRSGRWAVYTPGHDRWSSKMTGVRLDTSSSEYLAGFRLGERCVALAQELR